jgi:hypothetical protein
MDRFPYTTDQSSYTSAHFPYTLDQFPYIVDQSPYIVDEPQTLCSTEPTAQEEPPMAADDAVTYRAALPSDAPAIAALHADSWRRHYRGAYSDAFLDGEVATERLLVWTDRMNEPGEGRSTIVAESEGRFVGFCHAVFDHDPRWGTLVDNLHVPYRLK